MTGSCAILVRELIAASRRKRYFIARTLYAAVLFGLVLSFLASVDESDLARRGVGQRLFLPFAMAQLLLVLAVCPAMCSDLIASERRQHTLDVLLACGQTPWRIVWNKLISRFMVIELLLLSSTVAMGVITFFGGVSLSQVLLVFINLSATALQWCSITILISSLFVEGYAVATLVYLLMIVCGVAAGDTRGCSYGSLFSVFGRSIFGRPARPSAPIGPTAAHVVMSVVVSWACLLAAARIARSGVSLRLGAVVRKPFDWIEAFFSGGDKKTGRKRAPRHVGRRPVLWREIYAGVLGKRDHALRAGYLSIMLLEVVYIVYILHDSNLRELPILGCILLGIVQLIALRLATTCVAVEKENQTLDVLLTTPLSAGQIIRAKVLAVLWHILPLVAVTMIHSLILEIGSWQTGLAWRGNAYPLVQSLLGIVASVAFVVVWGINLSLISRTPGRAFVMGLVTLVVLSLCFPVLVGLLPGVHGWGSWGWSYGPRVRGIWWWLASPVPLASRMALASGHAYFMTGSLFALTLLVYRASLRSANKIRERWTRDTRRLAQERNGTEEDRAGARPRSTTP